MTYVFDDDVAVEKDGDRRWKATIPERWNIIDVPNGGFVLSLMMAALARDVPHPDPLTVTGHFLSPTRPGGVEITTEMIKSGRTLSTAAISLSQDGRERVRALATCGDLDLFSGPTEIVGRPPELGDDLVSGMDETPMVNLAGQFDYGIPPEVARGLLGEPTGSARIAARIRFKDGRPPDLLCLPLIADAFPPAIFQLGHYGWTPTLELTVHFRARPSPGWLNCSIQTRYLQRGILEEDVEIWDSNCSLIGLSRQLALAATS